ncbi:MAG: oligoribonuclease [Deltaproteobacteria bacterium]|nr:MAG: oligoribonuclease [Deltaproteobacteria bacterium]
MHGSENLVWVDLEMTGLDPATCTIVEIASLITDSNLALVAEGPNLIIHQPADVLAQMKPEVVALHKRSGLLSKIPESKTTVAQAETATLELVKQHCKRGRALLCGNSIWKDRQFLERYMPELAGYLHYRMIDVSSIKELVRRWYGEDRHFPKKRECHRALDDIRESIAELQWYRSQVFVSVE